MSWIYRSKYSGLFLFTFVSFTLIACKFFENHFVKRCLQFCVQVNVWLQSSFLIEPHQSLYFSYFQSVIPCLHIVFIKITQDVLDLSIFIGLGKGGVSLCNSCSFLGYSTLTLSFLCHCLHRNFLWIFHQFNNHLKPYSDNFCDIAYP